MNKNFKKVAVAVLAAAQVATCGLVLPMAASAAVTTETARNMENLDRGVVAVKTDDGVFVSWRRLATEPADTQFTLYRNQTVVAEGAITNFVDASGTINDQYTVVTNGETMSDSVSVLADQYIEIPLAETPPYEGSVAADRNGVYLPEYAPGDSTYADLDGDGQYEIIMMWNPADAKDAATTGSTGKVYVDAYKLDGTFMWRIDMGYNIRAGQHDTMLCAADFDADGKAELILRTADGTTDAAGNVVGDAERGATYEASWAALNAGKNLQGPLYVTAFDGTTGTIIDTTDYFLNNETGSQAVSLTFGDDFGNRSERYNGTIAYLDGVNPSVVFARGYYYGKNISNPNGRSAAAAYSLKNNKLTQVWTFDTSSGNNAKYIGQGNHQIEAADVDGDGMDEIFYGALTWDQDGSILWCTFQEHGDAMHVGDFDPTKEGLEFMKVYEDYSAESTNFDLTGEELSPFITDNTIFQNSAAAAAGGASTTQHMWGGTLQNAATGEFYQIHNGVKDTGRGMIANIGYGDSYYIMWGAGSMGYWDNEGNEVGDLGLSMNSRIYWDGDLQEELQDHRGAGEEIVIQKWNDTTKQSEEIFVPENSHSINSTKGNVCAQGDLIGDWREEFVSYAIIGEETVETPYTYAGDPEDPLVDDVTPSSLTTTITQTIKSYALRVYTTTIPTDYNFYTLAHDDVYRNSSAVYSNCYNQPPHISWYMNDAISGSTYTTQPETNINLVKNSYTAKAFDASALPEGGSTAATDTTTDTTTSTTGLTDISGHWAEEYIEDMVSAGVINGYQDNTFRPDDAVTKGQFVKLISVLAGLEIGEAENEADWAVPYVEAATAANLLNEAIDLGDLNADITREEMATIVAAAAVYKGVDVSAVTAADVTDADAISDWAVDGVNIAASLGIVTGFETGDFRPAEGATRAQAATMMSRLADLF